LLALLGCGGIVHDRGTSTESAPALGSGGAPNSPVSASSGSVGSLVTGGTAGAYATDGATRASGGAFSSQDAGTGCHETGDRVRIEIQRSLEDGGSVPVGVGGGTSGSVDVWVTGVVLSVDRSSFTLTPCTVATCGGAPWTVIIDGVGLDLRGTLTAGNNVRVHSARVPQNPGANGGPVTTEILVTNLDLATDPSVTTVESLYVAANIGSDAIREAPFAVSYVDAACPIKIDCSRSAPGTRFDRALALSVPMGSAGTLQAAMGDSAMLYGTNGRLTLHDLRSIETNSCDGQSSLDTSYWITNQPYRE
jgi:hypothetical protein